MLERVCVKAGSYFQQLEERVLHPITLSKPTLGRVIGQTLSFSHGHVPSGTFLVLLIPSIARDETQEPPNFPILVNWLDLDFLDLYVLVVAIYPKSNSLCLEALLSTKEFFHAQCSRQTADSITKLTGQATLLDRSILTITNYPSVSFHGTLAS